MHFSKKCQTFVYLRRPPAFLSPLALKVRCETLLYAECFKVESWQVFKTSQNWHELTCIGGVPKGPDTFLRGAYCVPVWLRGALWTPPTDRHDTPMRRMFFLVSQKNHGRNTEDTREESQIGTKRSDWRTPWRIISIAFTSKKTSTSWGHWGSAFMLSTRPLHCLEKSHIHVNMHKYLRIPRYSLVRDRRIQGCLLVTPLKGLFIGTRLDILV